MTITARLSSRFYQQFGDEITNELVEWFNAMDTHAQLQLRELNDLNFIKLSAELNTRFAEQDSRIERRVTDVELKFSRQLSEVEIKLTNQINDLDKRLSMQIAELRTELHTSIAKVKSRLSWQMTGTFVTIVGVMVSIGVQVLYH